MGHCICGAQFELAVGELNKSFTCTGCGAVVRAIVGDDGQIDGMLRVKSGPSGVGAICLFGGTGPVRIGRRTLNEVILAGQGVSREHCRLVRQGSGWLVEDLDSANGIEVNAQKVKKHLLVEGDVIGVDQFELEYVNVHEAGEYELGELGGSDYSEAAVKPLASKVAESFVDASNDMEDIFELDDPPEQLIEAPSVDHIEGGSEDNTVGISDQATGVKPVCPGCGKQLNEGAKICIECGLDVTTGRPVVVNRAVDENRIYHNAEQIIRAVSWVDPIGVYPIASEAVGDRTPWAARTIAVLTILVSCWFWWLSGPQMWWGKNLMLWVGDAPSSADRIEQMYYFSDWGDTQAFERKFEEKMSEVDTPYEDAVIAAHESLPANAQAIGQYRWYQLLTHALLHADIFHLLGNLYFLMIFGTRVNALVGNIGMAVLYPVVGVLAAVAHMWSVASGEPGPMLGASGAVMGMAGMYLMLFPVNRVHVAAWMRWGLLRGWHLSLNIWPIKGIWVVLFYIVFDVIYVTIGLDTGVAHWAHIGGFVAGAVVVLVLQLLRVLNAGGGDMISVLLGKRAWAIVGRPNDRDKMGFCVPAWLRVGAAEV